MTVYVLWTWTSFEEPIMSGIYESREIAEIAAAMRLEANEAKEYAIHKEIVQKRAK